MGAKLVNFHGVAYQASGLRGGLKIYPKLRLMKNED
jgi:hypothetical protein